MAPVATPGSPGCDQDRRPRGAGTASGGRRRTSAGEVCDLLGATCQVGMGCGGEGAGGSPSGLRGSGRCPLSPVASTTACDFSLNSGATPPGTWFSPSGTASACPCPSLGSPGVGRGSPASPFPPSVPYFGGPQSFRNPENLGF